MDKHKVLFVCPYPFDEAPSQRFRFEQYLPFLREAGYRYEIAPFLDLKAWRILYKSGKSLKKFFMLSKSFAKRLSLLFKLSSYEYIFIHREATPFGPPFFEWIVRYIWTKKIIYDFDDAIWLEDPSEKGSLKARIKWKSKVSQICKWSYKLSCGNAYLAHFAKEFNKNVLLNPTTIDTTYHKKVVVKQSKKLVIGWTGTHSTLPYLKNIIPVLDTISHVIDFELLIISNQRPDFDVSYIRYLPWRKETEIEDLNKMDLGIMPLTDDIWSTGKCGFKILQYMAVHKPVVASSVGVNKKLIQESLAGFAANTMEEWREAIIKLLNNEMLRKELGDKGKKYVEEHYSVHSNRRTFLSLFQ